MSSGIGMAEGQKWRVLGMSTDIVRLVARELEHSQNLHARHACTRNKPLVSRRRFKQTSQLGARTCVSRAVLGIKSTMRPLLAAVTPSSPSATSMVADGTISLLPASAKHVQCSVQLTVGMR